MAKITLTDITTGYQSMTVFNANNAVLEAALDNTLSRDGTAPNAMAANLDMNSFRVTNLPDAVANQEPITLAQAASIASVSTTFSQENVGSTLWPATAAETAASVTPTNYYYEPGNVLRYGTNTLPGTTDMLTAFQNAFAVAKAELPTKSTQADGASGYSDNGTDVYLPAGRYYISSTIEVPYNVAFRGEGKRSSVITSDYDGQIVRTEYDSTNDPYSNRSGTIRDIRITGDLTKTSQVGLDVLRWAYGSTIRDVEVDGCGSHGVILRECAGGLLRGVSSQANVGDGIVLQVGVDNWTDLNSTGNPCNAVTIQDCVGALNDGPGLRINDSNGIKVQGGFYQNNYDSGGNNTGYNIIVDSDLMIHNI